MSSTRGNQHRTPLTYAKCIAFQITIRIGKEIFLSWRQLPPHSVRAEGSAERLPHLKPFGLQLCRANLFVEYLAAIRLCNLLLLYNQCLPRADLRSYRYSDETTLWFKSHETWLI